MSTVSLRLAAALGVAVGVQPAGTIDRHLAASVPVRLVLDQTRYAPGATGHVGVRIGEDGYLVVLYAQPDGHLEVAFPLDPGSSDAVKADSEIEIAARGSPGAFTVEDSSGVGTWYAAISTRPFRFDSIATHGHWDYRRVPRMTDQPGVERALTGFVEGLATGRFDYDIVTFVIDPSAATASSPAPASRLPPPASDTSASGPPSVWPGPIVWLPGWVGPWSWTRPPAGPYYDRALPGAPVPKGTIVPPSAGTAGAPKDAPPPESHPPHGERHHTGTGGSGSAGSGGSRS